MENCIRCIFSYSETVTNYLMSLTSVSLARPIRVVNCSSVIKSGTLLGKLIECKREYTS